MDWGAIFSNTAGALLAPTTIAYALAATGLAMHFGFTGLLNFGMAAFMAIGGYGFAIPVLSFGWPWWLAMIFSLLCAALFALLLGLPTLRLRADYLAIVTIAAAEVVRLLFTTQTFDSITNSADGLDQFAGRVGTADREGVGFLGSSPFPELSGADRYGFGPWQFTASQLWIVTFGLIVLALAILFLWQVMRSPWGRIMKGIREDEDAVRSLGKNVFSYKLQSLMIGGVIGAAGGIIYVLPSAVLPSQYVPSMTFFLWTILLLGGAATVFGPFLGSLIFWGIFTFLQNLLPGLSSSGILPFTSIQAGTVPYILIGVSLMLLVIFRPQGILGDKREMTFVK